MPLAKVDPPRTLPADRWNGLFCKEWIDATRHCTSDGTKVVCADRTAAEMNRYRPKQVECIDDLPIGETLRFCAQIESSDSLHLLDGTDQQIGWAGSGAFISYRPDIGRWCYSLAEDSLFPSRRPDDKRVPMVYARRDISCSSVYAGNETDSVSIEPTPGSHRHRR